MCRKRKIRIDNSKTFMTLLTEVGKRIDEPIFNATSNEELGEVYYRIFLSNVKNPEKQIYRIFQNLASRLGENITCKEELYSFICHYYNIKKLPKCIFDRAKVLFDGVFNTKYKKAEILYNKTIASIEKDTKELELKISQISSLGRKLNFDTTEDVDNIKSYLSQKNLLRTKREILDKSFKLVKSTLDEFCDLNNPKDVANRLKNIAIQYSADTLEVDFAFSKYDMYLDALIYSIEKYENLFYDNKFYPFFQLVRTEVKMYKIGDGESEELEKFKSKQETLTTRRDLFISLKKQSTDQYLTELKCFLNEYSIFEKTKELSNTLACLSNRKSMLINALNFFEETSFDIFNNIIPIQIEGIFNDLIDDLDFSEKISDRKDNYSNALKAKVENLSDSIPFEYICYYGFFFNNVIRNIVAHGRLNNKQNLSSEVLSIELLLDLYSLLYMVSRYSDAETMYRYIENFSNCMDRFCRTKEDSFKILYNDLTKQRTHVEYDMVSHYPPRRIVMWLINPYYENLYLYRIGSNENKLTKIRQLLLSEEFWSYMTLKLQKWIQDGFYYELEKNYSMKPLVESLLGCQLPQDAKKAIIEFRKEINNIDLHNNHIS